jgi:hypothetical protein
MNPNKVKRYGIKKLTDLPNIGQAMAGDLLLLEIRSPGDLVGRDPFELFESLCIKTRSRQDPCVLDTFMSITDFMAGNEPRPWWDYTEKRKKLYGPLLEQMVAGTGKSRNKR